MSEWKCYECGMELSSAAEYHPHAFCVLVKAGINPWALVYEAIEIKAVESCLPEKEDEAHD